MRESTMTMARRLLTENADLREEVEELKVFKERIESLAKSGKMINLQYHLKLWDITREATDEQ